MFDVPVLDVTVSSAEIFISGIRQTNQITLQTSPFAPALLNALPVPPPIDRLPAPTTVEKPPSNVTHTKTLLPDGQFQLLQPLNLAATTQALAKVLERSLEDLPSQPTSIRTLLTPETPGAGSETPDVVGTIISNPPLVKTIQLTAASSSSEKSISALPTKALHQCIDIPVEATSGDAATLQVWIQGNLLGEVSTLNGTEDVVRSLQTMLVHQPFDPDEITPVLTGDKPAIRLGRDIRLQVLHQAAASETADIDDTPSTLDQEWTAIVWSDQLRRAMGAPPLDAGNMQVLLKGLTPSEQTLDGTASWYGPYFHGRQTANGEIFDQNTLTAAHKSLPFDTVLQVRNLKNNRTVVVRINDRGPYIGKRSLDLSKAAAQCLGSEQVGVIPYEAVILDQTIAD